MKPEHLTLIILAGGKSRRFGTDKAELPLGNLRLIDCLVAKGKALGFGEILLSGYRGNVSGCRTIPDVIPERGPLGGLMSALAAARNPWAFVVPVDCPGIGEETICRMIACHEGGTAEVTLLHNGSRIQPLIGVYPSSFADVIQPVIRTGPAPVFRALDQVCWQSCQPAPEEPAVLNLNTKEVYLAYKREYEHHRNYWRAAAVE